jgi:hypothetical protein
VAEVEVGRARGHWCGRCGGRDQGSHLQTRCTGCDHRAIAAGCRKSRTCASFASASSASCASASSEQRRAGTADAELGAGTADAKLGAGTCADCYGTETTCRANATSAGDSTAFTPGCDRERDPHESSAGQVVNTEIGCEEKDSDGDAVRKEACDDKAARKEAFDREERNDHEEVAARGEHLDDEEAVVLTRRPTSQR